MKPYTYDANGNTLSDPSGKSYTWDFENHLTQVVVPGTGTVTFKYDPFRRRIQKSGPLGTTNFLYDNDNLIEELDSTGSVLARYTQGQLLDEPLAMLRGGRVAPISRLQFPAEKQTEGAPLLAPFEKGAFRLPTPRALPSSQPDRCPSSPQQ